MFYKNINIGIMSRDYTTKQPYIIQISYIILRFSEVKTLIIMNVISRLLSIEDSFGKTSLRDRRDN